MITLYSWATPNGRKIAIALEELGLPYEVRTVDINKAEQHEPSFLEISPNNKIPAIRDHDTGVSLFESGAILLYLAEKTGTLIPADAKDRAACLQWLLWQVSSQGPMLGQAHHYIHFHPDKAPYVGDRCRGEALRLYQVLEAQLARQTAQTSPFMAGRDLSIADIATFPWVARHDWQGIELDNFPHIRSWHDRLGMRPAFQRGYDRV